LLESDLNDFLLDDLSAGTGLLENSRHGKF